MKTSLLVAAALLALALPANAASCAPLLTDPAGDAQTPPSPADDASAVDIVSADLRTSRADLVATVRVADLPAGGSVASHLWEVRFSANEQRYRVSGSDNLNSWRFDAAHVVSSTSDVPEDEQFGSSALESIGDGTGTIDTRNNTVTIRIPLALFRPYGGVTGRLYDVRAVTATGVGAPAVAVYELGDRGRTDRSAGTGRRC